MSEKVIGSIYVGKSDKFGCGTVNKTISHTLLTGGECAVILGYMDNGTGQHQSNTVYSTKGLSPALNTCSGYGVPMFVESKK